MEDVYNIGCKDGIPNRACVLQEAQLKLQRQGKSRHEWGPYVMYGAADCCIADVWDTFEDNPLSDQPVKVYSWSLAIANLPLTIKNTFLHVTIITEDDPSEDTRSIVSCPANLGSLVEVAMSETNDPGPVAYGPGDVPWQHDVQEHLCGEVQQFEEIRAVPPAATEMTEAEDEAPPKVVAHRRAPRMSGKKRQKEAWRRTHHPVPPGLVQGAS